MQINHFSQRAIARIGRWLAIDVNGLRSARTAPVTGIANAAPQGASFAAPQTQNANIAAVESQALAAYDARLKRYPYLTDLVNDPNDPGKGYVAINWATDRSATTGSVRWGAVAGDGSCTASTVVAASQTALTVNSVPEYQWKALLTLTPGTQYCYRVYLSTTDLLGGDPAPRFWTQVPIAAGEAFSFAVFGDWGATEPTGTDGTNPDQANVIQQIANSGVRFGLTTGDNGYPSGSQTNYGDLVETGPSISGVFGPQFWAVAGDSIALFPAIGNHGFARSDTNHPHLLNWPQDRAVALSGGRYLKECCTGSSTSYASAWYAFDAGIARFYVLHAAWSDSCTPGGYACDYNQHWSTTSSEYQWLEQDLATHPSALKFALFHYPLYSDQRAETSNPLLQGANSLEGLLARYGVDLAFYGHAHIYQRNLQANPDSLPSYLTGGAGAKLQSIGEEPCLPFDAFGIGWSNTNNQGNACGAAPIPNSKAQVYHFIKVSVSSTIVTVSGIDELGNSFDIQTYAVTTPDTAITTAPSEGGSATSASFTFSSPAANATFECSLDNAPYSQCTSPVQYTNLAHGTHTFAVRAINTTSDADATPALHTWTINLSVPTATATDTATATPTATDTATATATDTATATATLPPLPTDTATPTATATATLPPLPTDTPTATPTLLPLPTNTPTATATQTATPAGPTTLTFFAEADAYVVQSNANANFGNASVLLTDTSPQSRSYLRFTTSGIVGGIQSAKLRVFVADGTSNGPQLYASTNTWLETSLTWNNQPGQAGIASDDLAGIAAGTWVEFNATPLVTGNGTYSFVFIPKSSNGLDLASRESTNRPQLVITFGGTLPPTATPTPGGGTIRTFSADADATVEEANPNTNVGFASLLLSDAAPNRHAYLQFTLSGITGTIQRARLRVFATDGTSNGPQIFATSNGWTESGITWANRPATVGSASDDLGNIANNTWIEFDVTAQISTNGTYSFVLIPQSNNGLDIVSRQGSQPPQLLITLAP
jgi:hypothetical protein